MYQKTNLEDDQFVDKYLPYRGNPNLKRLGVKISWTSKRIEEYLRCAQDPVYFTENYMKIINVDDGLVPFKLYDYQKEILRSFAANRFTVITTARQAGKSTTTCAFILWYILFHSDKVVALLANKADTAREILGRVQLAYQHLPKWLQHGVGEWNKGSFVLENNSRVIAGATSTDSIRGFSVNFLFIDECAHIDNWDEFYTSTFPTISSGKSTKIGLVSTPNGLNHFYDIWHMANAPEKDERGNEIEYHGDPLTRNGRNGYHPIKVMWHEVPGRDEKWRLFTLAGLNFNEEKFRQEYCCEFLGSSGTLISGHKLQLLREAVENPTAIANSLNIYRHPERGHLYMCICDVSRGKGLDYSAFSIIDVTEVPFRQVCTFRDNMITPVDYAEHILHACRYYNNAYNLTEINDIGGQVVDSLWNDYEYEHLISTGNAGRAGKRVQFDERSERGIRTTKPIKNMGCMLLKLLVEQNRLEIYDRTTVEELCRFSRKGSSFEAEEGSTDDLTMSLVLFGWLSDQQWLKDLNAINTMQELRDKTYSGIHDELEPCGIFQSDFDVEEQQDHGWTVETMPSWVYIDEWE